MMHENCQRFTYRLRGLFSETQVCKPAGKVRISKALPSCSTTAFRRCGLASVDGRRKMSINSIVVDDCRGAEKMANDRQHFSQSRAAGPIGGFLLNVLVVASQIARLLIVALLMAIEPIVGFVLCGLALLGVIVSVIIRFSGAVPNFPFWHMLAMSIGLYFAFLLYVFVTRALVPQPHED
jgi:hypothetical protein